MIEVENIDVYGWKSAIRGMRNPLNSWARSDSDFTGGKTDIGDDDLTLATRLVVAGTEHRKFLRMINVTMDITAPLYWWKEYDTYKVGTVANSCSTMHTIHRKGVTKDLFSLDNDSDLYKENEEIINNYFELMEKLRANCKSGDDNWRALIQLLPEGFNQRRTVQFNYEVAMNIIKQRRHHKLIEWRQFADILEDLPYMRDLRDRKVEEE